MEENKMKQIDGFDGYFIDENGNVFSQKGNGRSKNAPKKLLKQSTLGTGGYPSVVLMKNKIVNRKRVHVLMLETFICPRPTGFVGCHNDGNKLNNHISNLRWDTQKNNELDKSIHGTAARGETQGSHKLNANQVIVARQFCKTFGYGSQKKIAKVFGVSETTIGRSISMKTWKHI